MTFLESDQVSLCDLLEQENMNSLLIDGKCVRRDPGEIQRLQVVSKQNVTFCGIQACTNQHVYTIGRVHHAYT